MKNSKIEHLANYDIIDDILNSEAKAFEGDNPKPKSQITAANFFTKENIGGPITKEEWLLVIRTMSKPELTSYKTFLEKLTKGEKIDFSPLISVDEDGRNYLWARFRYKNGSQSFKVFIAGEFCKFLVMYQMGLLTVSLTLEELYTEAKK